MCTQFLFHSFSFKAPLVDSSDSGHSGTAVIMLVSVVLMGLAVFVIYKFKRYSSLDIIYCYHIHGAWKLGVEINPQRFTSPQISTLRWMLLFCLCMCAFCITTPFRVGPIIYTPAPHRWTPKSFPEVFRLHISLSYGHRRHNNSSRNKTIPLCLNLQNITGNDSLINSPRVLNGCQSPAVINIHLSDNVRVDLSEMLNTAIQGEAEWQERLRR